MHVYCTCQEKEIGSFLSVLFFVPDLRESGRIINKLIVGTQLNGRRRRRIDICIFIAHVQSI